MKAFWNQVQRCDGDGCWEWTGRRRKRRGVTSIGGHYGMANYEGKGIGAHRLSWILEHGYIPHGSQVLHRCDNPPCVRPDHLFLGTAADNMADKTAKGRQAKGDGSGSRRHPEKRQRGESHWMAKLTEDDVREIRKRRADGELMLALAKAFGVSEMQISYIVRRKQWTHVK